ncbi:tetratricopeptide repeat protein [Candidatus Saccharibacteria bacterium]|nr:tetratricopeptide repeat protein [Candidatus Saccharibacteria bacterium]
MLGIVLIFLFTCFLIFGYPILAARKKVETSKSPRYNAQMKKLWSIAQDSMRERKPLRAEKALLTILKFDEKNAAAYNRLGILYAKEQKFDEAIECFEIAQSLDNNPSSLHNAGLIYLETGAYEKAAMAFEQALELEGGIPARFIALAKAYEKLGNRKGSIDALEAAYELDNSTTTLRQILALHEASGDTEKIAETTARIEEQLSAIAQKTRSRKTVASRVSRLRASRLKTRAEKKPSRRKKLKTL